MAAEKQNQTTRWIRKLVVSIGLALLTLGLASAQDRVTFSGTGEKVKAPGVANNKDRELEKAGQSKEIKGTDGVGFEMVPNMSPSSPGSLTAKRMQELIDKKKNWIFRTTEDLNNNSAVKEMIGMDDDLVMSFSDKPKNSVERFLRGGQDKDNANAQKTPVKRGNDESLTDSTSSEDTQTKASSFGSSSASGPDTVSAGFDRLFDQGRVNLNASQRLDAPFRNPLQDASSLQPLSSSSTLAGRFDPAHEQKKRAEEFRQLLSGPQGSAPLAGPADPINSLFSDTTRQSLQPVLPRSSSLLPAGSPGGLDNLSGVATPSRSALPGMNDLNLRTLGPSSLAPAFLPAPEPRLVQPRPAVLEIPKRSF
jgi:hypothetical protein